jgi:hypothetical protein
MSRRGLLWSIPLLIQCATTPHAPQITRPADATRTPAAVTAAPPSPPGTATVASGDPPSSFIHSADEKPASDESWGGMGMHEVTEKDWLKEIRQKVAEQHKVDPGALIFSPGKLRAAFVRDPAAPTLPDATPVPATRKKPPPRPRIRRFQIVVVDNQGRKLATFRPITARGSDEPPKDLKFLGEDRLLYEVVAAPPPAPPDAIPSPKPEPPAAKGRSPRARGNPGASKTGRKVARASKPPTTPNKNLRARAPAPSLSAHDNPSPPPPRLFVIQSLEPRARALRCEGYHFTLTAQNERIAFVAGTPESAFVAVDGAQVYPRRGHSILPGALAWSKDGRSLAFIEAPPAGPPRLVMLADFDNPTGDTTWDLPASTPVDGIRVFWSGPSKLIVGKTATRPLFSTSFEKQMPR